MFEPRSWPAKRCTQRARWALILASLLLATCSLSPLLAFDLNLMPDEQEDELRMIEQQQQTDSNSLKSSLSPGEPEEHRSSGQEQASGGGQQPTTPDDENKPAQAAGAGGWWNHVKRATSCAVESTIGQLPQYFNFKTFSAQFKRHYSRAELALRKSLFLKRCVQVFKSRVAFRSGRKSYTESVNHFADRSDDEFEQIYMSGPPFELRPEGQSEREYNERLEQARYASSRWGGDAGELTSRASLDDDGSDGEHILNEAQAKRQLELMLADEGVDEQTQLAFLEEMRGTAQEEGFSQAALGQPEVEGPPLPWPGMRPMPEELRMVESSSSEPLRRRPYVAPEIGPDEGIDWSRHQCFHKVYDQGIKCGKCYVMAATTLAEFYKCSENLNEINRRQFSKDYVLDCGQKFSATILGCTGGSLLDTIQFIAKAGLHNIKGWRTIRDTKLRELNLQGIPIGPLDRKCPLNRLDTPIEQWGQVKIGIKPVQVDANDWLEALEDGPLAVSVQMPAEGVSGYASGVHDGAGCATSGHWHSLLLVGYGVNERGIAYWRFRNSWGQQWGDNGHFDMAMSVPGECLIGGVRLYRDPAISST